MALISKDGPCYNSELRQKDVITKIDGVTLNKMSDLRRYIYTKKPGEQVALTVFRNNREIEIKVKLGRK